MPWLKAFLHIALMNEHSLGFSLKEYLSRREREQALTGKVKTWHNLSFN
ncbi:hypothetical protein JOC78_001949 [Bacillus ectoiniformans]|nr:hypothetical protein [Bacillus ectoiniformans]